MIVEPPRSTRTDHRFPYTTLFRSVGASGAGKSTILNLIPRFYDPAAGPNGGMVTIDGQDLRGVTLDSLRGAIGLVSQEILLFDDTLRANIAYGRDRKRTRLNSRH